jgi:hypothetical protein
MEMNVFQALGDVLGLYSNIAIAWMMAVVADLVVNKPLGCRPSRHRVQARAPVRHQPGGRGRDGHRVGCCRSVAHLGAFGPLAQAFSALIALVTAFVAPPLIAWATKGRYYIARRTIPIAGRPAMAAPAAATAAMQPA